MCVLILSTMFVRNICRSKKKSARYCHKCRRSSCKLALFLSDLNETLILSTYFGNTQKTIRREPSFYMGVGAQTDRQTDMTKLIVAFRNFVDAPKNYSTHQISSLYIDLLFG